MAMAHDHKVLLLGEKLVNGPVRFPTSGLGRHVACAPCKALKRAGVYIAQNRG